MNRSRSCLPYTLDGDYYGEIGGPFAGVGPKNYHRSPENIREDVCRRLTEDPDLDASDMEVEVNDDGEVTLTGTVESRRAKRVAEEIIANVAGVSDVHNRLRIAERQLP